MESCFLQCLANGLVEAEFNQDLWWRRSILRRLGGTYTVTDFLALIPEVDFSCQAAVELLFPELGFAEELQQTFFPAGQVMIAGNGFHVFAINFARAPRYEEIALLCQSVWLLPPGKQLLRRVVSSAAMHS